MQSFVVASVPKEESTEQGFSVRGSVSEFPESPRHFSKAKGVFEEEGKHFAIHLLHPRITMSHIQIKF